jgi:uroporphyrinogen decarboxylase
MNHRERLEACISNAKMDNPPVALWRHFPVDDQSAERLAGAITTFQNTYNFDFIKVTPASSYCLKDWGVQDTWKANDEGTREIDRYPIKNPDDIKRLLILDPKKGSLGQQLHCLRLLRKEYDKTTPIIQTIFSPLSQAKNLIGRDQLPVYIRQYPEFLHALLKTITATTIQFIQACVQLEIDGVFYAVQHGSYSILSPDEFDIFQKPYDLQILSETKIFWLNMVHIHGENIMFEKFIDYPVGILNWHDRHSKTSLAEGLSQFKGIACGGLRRYETLVLGDPASIMSESRDALDSVGGQRLILGTGCVLPITAPHGNILAAKYSVDQYG